MDPFEYEFRVAGGDWTVLPEEAAENGDTVLFMMEDRDTDYVTYDGEVPYLPGVSGKVEYRRKTN